jgi:hypothetical protein
MNWFKQIVTGADNSTHDMGRWSWLISMFAIIGHSTWSAIQHVAVDLGSLAQALGVVVAAHGAAIWAKKDTEPPKE